MRAHSLIAVALVSWACASCRRAPEPAAPRPERADAGPTPPPQPAPLGPPVSVQEQEPNDAQHAQGVPERSVVAGSLTPPRKGSDDDWYRVTPGPGRLLALRVELRDAAAGDAGAGALDAALEIYDRDRNKLLHLRATAAEPAVVAAVACLEACFVRVSGAVRADYVLTLLGAPPAAGDELEPNDRAVDATALAAGASAQGTFYSVEDEDWFRVVAARPLPGQFLRVAVSAVPGVRPELEIHALDGALLATLRAAAAGDAIAVRDLPLLPPAAPTVASATIASATNSADAGALGASSPAPASQSAGAQAAGAAQAAVAPQPAGAPQAAPGTGAAAADGGGPLVASTAGAAAALAPEPDAGTVATQLLAPAADAGTPAAGAGGAAFLEPALAFGPDVPAPDAGAAVAAAAATEAGYLLVLRSAWISAEQAGGKPHRGRSAGAPYTLRTTLEAGPGDLELEPNDDPAHATPLTGQREGYLAPAGDVDWYRVHADAPAVLRVELGALARADAELSVWLPGAHPGDKPVLLARANEGGVREGELLPAVGIPAGDALVKVESALRNLDGKWTRDGEDPDTLYKLTVALSPDDGTQDREPNDDVAHAQQVPLPARLTGTLWPKRDVDVFRFHVPAGHVPLDLRVSAVRGVDVMLTLRELKSLNGRVTAEVIGTADQIRGEGEEALIAVPLIEGDYALEVSSPHKDASATQQYTLEIRDSQQ